MKILVLLSTFNGEKYLREQLDSLINQKLQPTKILIRDDGSKDNTINIIKEYQNKYDFIEYFEGQNLGPAKSFFELINKAEDADYYALCDQDDYWKDNKISSAIALLEKEPNNIPLLYMSRYILTDEKLNPISYQPSSLYQYTDFAHALLYTTSPGCTFVFNRASKDRIKEYDINNNFCIIHDSIIHKVVAMFGKVILDENKYIYYRQHSNNEIGLATNSFKEFLKRISNVLSRKHKNIRSNLAKSLFDVYGNYVDEDKLDIIKAVAFYKENRNYKRMLLKDERFKVKGLNYLFYKILVLFNYI